MTKRTKEFRCLYLHIEATKVVSDCTVEDQIASMAIGGHINAKELLELQSYYNKASLALTELKAIARRMADFDKAGNPVDDEPHGSRDTFVPKPKGPMTQDEWLESMKEKEEIANAFEDYNAMQD